MENPFKFEYETDLDIATCREIMTPECNEHQRESDTHFFYKESSNRGLSVVLKKNGTIKLVGTSFFSWYNFKVKLRPEHEKTILECRYSSYIDSLFYWLIPIALLLSCLVCIVHLYYAGFMMSFFFLLLSGIPEVFRYNTAYKIVTNYLEVALQAKRVPK
jgi:hypothetical protein